MDQRLKLTHDEQKLMIEAIKEYFINERGEELGELAAMLLIEFMVEKLGPALYNRGMRDAINYLTNRLEDMQELEIWR